MNLLRVRIYHGDILTFMMRQRLITVVVRSMWYRHVMVRDVIQGQLTHSKNHNAHTSHALEDIRQIY